MDTFVHLHVHSDYSLLDGMITIDQLVNRAVDFGMPAVALTDQGNLHGVLDFYHRARNAGVKPILGCEVLVAPVNKAMEISDEDQSNYYQLVLLAENNQGYANLVKIVSDANIKGSQCDPYTDLKFLSEHSGGLIALSGCLKGKIPYHLAHNGLEEAKEAARRLIEVFGPENFFLEIQDTGLPGQQIVNTGLLQMAQDLDLSCVATNDCRYLNRDSAKAHHILQAYQAEELVTDPSQIKPETDLLYFRSPQEMADIFKDQPELLSNSLLIADRCNVELDLYSHHFPPYPFLEGRSPEDVLKKKAMAGLNRRLIEEGVGSADRAKYYQRLEHELEVIWKAGFTTYVLTVSEYVNWAMDNGFPVGPGRGSVVGSLVAYSMRITALNPIRYGLLFERFKNAERFSIPDIDIDFCFSKRDQVVNHLTTLYGEDKVAGITAFGILKAKQAIFAVGQTLGIPEAEIEEITNLIPAELGMTLKKALEQEPRLNELVQRDPKIAVLFDLSMHLEGIHHHTTTHGAGVVISPGPLTDYLPIYQDENGKTITQFDLKCVEQAGLIKFDILGLRTLTVIDTACGLIRKNQAPEFDIERIPLDDDETFNLLSRGDTDGVFQLESSGIKDLLIKIRPSVFEDIIALLSLYPSGPESLILDYIERKHGRKEVKYLHPSLDPVLKETYGVIIYHEQIMRIAQIMAGFTLGKADILHRAMRKKIAVVIEEQRAVFMEGARNRRVDERTADKIYDLILESAFYSFNKAHAAAYGLLTYRTAYLKANYPAEFKNARQTDVIEC